MSLLVKCTKCSHINEVVRGGRTLERRTEGLVDKETDRETTRQEPIKLRQTRKVHIYQIDRIRNKC